MKWIQPGWASRGAGRICSSHWDTKNRLRSSGPVQGEEGLTLHLDAGCSGRRVSKRRPSSATRGQQPGVRRARGWRWRLRASESRRVPGLARSPAPSYAADAAGGPRRREPKAKWETPRRRPLRDLPRRRTPSVRARLRRAAAPRVSAGTPEVSRFLPVGAA